MARLPDPLDTLTPEARLVYDKIAAKRGSVRGPFAPLMHHPALAEHIGALGEFLRFGSTLPGDVRELAILVVARAAGQAYEWTAHAPIARKEGVPDDVIERVRTEADLSTLPPRYAKVAQLIQHVLAHRLLPPVLQERVQLEWGVAGLVELVVIPGHYQLIAGVLSAFDVPLPDGVARPF